MSYADPRHLDLCDSLGLCPACGDSVTECRCDEDAELEACVTSHPAGCLCHAEGLDAEWSRAQVRVLAPGWRMRQVESAFIDSGVL